MARKWRLLYPQLGSKLEKYAILAEAPGTATTITTVTTIKTITGTITSSVHLLDKDKDEDEATNRDTHKDKDKDKDKDKGKG